MDRPHSRGDDGCLQLQPGCGAWERGGGSIPASRGQPGDNHPDTGPSPHHFASPDPSLIQSPVWRNPSAPPSSSWVGVVQFVTGCFPCLSFLSLPFPFEGGGVLWLGGVNAPREASETQVDVSWGFFGVDVIGLGGADPEAT